MLDILKQFPYFGMVERILEKVPKEYLESNIYKESSPKEYGQKLLKKKHKRA